MTTLRKATYDISRKKAASRLWGVRFVWRVFDIVRDTLEGKPDTPTEAFSYAGPLNIFPPAVDVNIVESNIF